MEPSRFDEFIRTRATALRADDRPPATKAEWAARRAALRAALQAAMGPVPAVPVPLDPKLYGAIDRDGYRIEKIAFQTRPDVWVTGNVYIPTGAKKLPAVLAVHGHWAGARRDPTVQARCLGLMKLGFVVLCIDAFGSGERFTTPAKGTYHGALYGSTLWPTGHTLLGMQVYDNRRAVDYLQTRTEVDPTKIGITGASGGGNQTMYAAAMDERLQCAVPVCSVGQFQAYLKAACCVCEVLPGALRFTEEGDVLGMVAPRALMVINATRDAFQFSPGEAKKSLERAKAIYSLHNLDDRVKHVIFESGHDYSQPMREAMYGWMRQWLQGRGDGSPVPEPAHLIEPPEALACFPKIEARPATWLTPPTFAGRVGRELVAAADRYVPRHREEWESTTASWRSKLTKILGEIGPAPRPAARPTGVAPDADLTVATLQLTGEAGMPIPMFSINRRVPPPNRPAGLVLHLDGKAAALKHPLTRTLASAGWLIAAPDLRATGVLKPPSDAIGRAVDHNSAEHALWIGRPLLGQWLFDVQSALEWITLQPGRDATRTAVIGLGQAGVVAILAAALFPDRVTSVAAVDSLVSLVTTKPYADGTRMGLLAPGLLTVGDVPHLAAMAAPRRLALIEGRSPTDQIIRGAELRTAFTFTRRVYEALRLGDRLTIEPSLRWEELANKL